MAVVPTLPDYVLTEKLGKGSYATVYKAYRKGDTREVVAVKCVQKSSLTKSAVENIITEISILKKVKHDHIVELKDFQWDNSYIFLILEYCSGGDLSQFIRCKKRLPESAAQKFLQQLAMSLQVLRSHNIAHMDLKPQNILLSSKHNPVLKLGDFGLAQYLHPDTEASSLRGSPLYMAPEILLKHHYDARVDLWSVGIILYECLFGQAPFSSQTFAELAEKIKSSNPVEIPYGAQVSDNCRKLILGLLQRDPNKRITFEAFFNDPFVDLEHMPTSESYTKGVDLVQNAVEADTECKYTKAIELYSKALEYLVPHMYREKDPTKRKEFRRKLLEYINRAEELKSIEKEMNASDNLEPKDDIPKFDEFIEDKPLLKQAFLYGAQADLLVNQQNYEEASRYYQEALEIMVPTVSKISGPNKELLYTEVSKWMQKAEDLKSFLSILKQQKKVLSNIDSVHFNASKENLDSTCVIQ